MNISQEISTPFSYLAHPAVTWHQYLLQDGQQSAPAGTFHFLEIAMSWEKYANQSPVHKSEHNAEVL